MAEALLLKKLTKFIEENDSMPDDELAASLLEIIDEERGKKKRILVVGQIQYAGQEAIHTVALGPYSTVGNLDTYENWQARSEAHAASRTEGGKLAWDTSTKTGQGRFMIVPLLRTARDAWDFFRGTSRWEEGEILEAAEASIPEWSIRGSTENPDVGPACICGLGHHDCARRVELDENEVRTEEPEVHSTDEWDLEF